MDDLLSEIESYFKYSDLSALDISKWSVGMQLHHALLAINGITVSLSESSPRKHRVSFSPVRNMILLFKRIPRGRGKAPDVSLPDSTISQEELRTLLESARANIDRARNSDPLTWWRHELFGAMNRDTALRFIETHTKHHVLLARDIIRSNNVS
ncbi:MAG: hypothetical protein HKN43_13320 [Rhodothermales bacterium]|nr:hypothetical protein [Rhodothermales bacterium]